MSKRDEIFITTTQISTELKRSIRTVQHWIKKGDLKALRLNRTFLVLEKDYIEFKNRFMVKAS